MGNEWEDTTSEARAPFPIEPAGERRAYLVVVRGGNTGEIYPVLGPELVVGRAAGADLRINDEGVSRFHCKLRVGPDGVTLEDLASRNGSFCNGARIAGAPRALTDGDKLQVGTTTVLRFTLQDPTLATPRPATDGALRDRLTGAYNRRYFIDRLQSEVRFALRHRSALSLVLLHVDRFDAITAEHGATVADRLLVGLVAHVTDGIRQEDVFARLSGEEFALVSRSISPGDTHRLAERLRGSIAALPIPTDVGALRVTTSLAVATVGELHIESASDLLVAVDAALHRAKREGGDQVVVCTPALLRERQG